MAAALASLLSIVIVSGTPWRRIALVRKRRAAARCRWVVTRKSMVWPAPVHRPIQVEPLPSYADGGFIHAPADAHQPLASVKRLLELWGGEIGRASCRER